MNQAQKDAIARGLGIPDDEKAVLDGGSNHPYTCRCNVCRTWWVLMGPEDPETGEGFGPFTKSEVEAEKFRGAKRYDAEGDDHAE